MKDVILTIIILLIAFVLVRALVISYNESYNNNPISLNSYAFDMILEIKNTNLPLSNAAIKDRLSDKKLTRKEVDEILYIYKNEKHNELIKRLIND